MNIHNSYNIVLLNHSSESKELYSPNQERKIKTVKILAIWHSLTKNVKDANGVNNTTNTYIVWVKNNSIFISNNDYFWCLFMSA